MGRPKKLPIFQKNKKIRKEKLNTHILKSDVFTDCMHTHRIAIILSSLVVVHHNWLIPKSCLFVEIIQSEIKKPIRNFVGSTGHEVSYKEKRVYFSCGISCIK